MATFGRPFRFFPTAAGASVGRMTRDVEDLAIDVLADLDDFGGAADLEALRPVAHRHVLDGDQHALAHDLELGVDGAGQRRVAARMGFVVAAMVDNDDDAVEGVAQRLGRDDVGGHVDVLALRPDQALVEGVEDDHARQLAHELLAHCRYQQRVFLDHVGAAGDEVKRDLGVVGDLVVAAQRLGALLIAVCALEGAIDHGAAGLDDAARDIRDSGRCGSTGRRSRTT